MTKTDIVAQMAKDRMVEAMVENIAHQSMNADLMDLCQMVYVIILECEEDKVIDLWEHKQMQYFIARVIINQYRSSNSPYYTLIRKFRMNVKEVMEDARHIDMVEDGRHYKLIHYEQGE